MHATVVVLYPKTLASGHASSYGINLPSTLKQRCQESLIGECVCVSLLKCLDQNEPTKLTAFTTL
jgi:hypothetical protein